MQVGSVERKTRVVVEQISLVPRRIELSAGYSR